MNPFWRRLLKVYLWSTSLLALLFVAAFIWDLPADSLNPFRHIQTTLIPAHPFDLRLTDEWSLAPDFRGDMSFGHRYSQDQLFPPVPIFYTPPTTQGSDPLPPGVTSYVDPRAAALVSVPEKRTGANFLGFGYDAFTQGSSFAWSVHFPLPAIIFLLIPHALLLYDSIRQKLRIAQGLCPSCRYDLRAHAPGQNCPECGTLIR